MQEPSHIRATSFALAISVVFTAWLFFEYSNRPTSVTKRPVGAQPSPSHPSHSTQPVLPALNQPTTGQNITPSNLSITYKCEKNARISFSDTPCAGNENILSVTAVEKEVPPAHSDLERLKKTVAAMEASRLEREKAFAAAPKQATANSTNQSSEFECLQIDRGIASIDSQLRQLHSAQRGDYLTGERKKLTDRRFSLGC